MLSSFGSLHSPSSAGGWLLGQIQSDSFDPCDQIVWCLQQWGLIGRQLRATAIAYIVWL